VSPLPIPESAERRAYLDEYGPEYEPRKVLISPRLMVQLVEAASARRITVDWGKPDEEGFFSPTLTEHEELP
jgi:hypothetical protein